MKSEKLIGSDRDQFADEIIEELLRRSRRRIDHALRPIRRPEAAVGVVKSPLGDLLVALSAGGLALVHYLADSCQLENLIATLRLRFDPVEDPRSVKEVGVEVRRYLAGEADALGRKIDLALAGSPFQKRVLHELQAIPRGAVVSYQALGIRAGAPKGARAVGNALHNNPVPIYAPCHRVIAADGRLGGYGGGHSRKLQLLRSEGFELSRADAKLPDGIVWGHAQTKIYCRKSCRTAAHIDRSRLIFFAHPREAEKAGMRPCKICRPDQ